MFFWHVFEVFGWVSSGYLELSGFPECFFGGFHPFFGPEGVQKQGASRGPGLPGDSQGIVRGSFFT